jgi:hypothetical protein
MRNFEVNLGVKFNLSKDGKAWTGMKDGTTYVIRNTNKSGHNGATVNVFPKTGKMMKYRLDGFYKP